MNRLDPYRANRATQQHGHTLRFARGKPACASLWSPCNRHWSKTDSPSGITRIFLKRFMDLTDQDQLRRAPPLAVQAENLDPWGFVTEKPLLGLIVKKFVDSKGRNGFVLQNRAFLIFFILRSE
jgi:hypothetical protein